MSDVLLNLDSLVVRPKIAIDGKAYEILSPDELPVLTTHMLTAKGKRMDQLMNLPSLDEAGQTELEEITIALSDAIMKPVPSEVRAKLSDAQRISVIEAFSTLLLRKKIGTAAANLMGSLKEAIPNPTGAKPQTGAKPSRGSSASTAGRRAGGSAKRRSRS